MTDYLVLTAVGSDRPGLVDELTRQLAHRQLNIEESRMALLGGEFAIVLLASGEGAQVEALLADPAAVAAPCGLTATCRRTTAPGSIATSPALPYHLATTGMDHPGIVHQISALLHRFGVNIDDLETHVGSAPVSGTPVFSLEAAISVPVTVKLHDLRDALEELEHELNMDIELMALEGR